MNAGYTVIEGIIQALEANEGAVFHKLASRYRKDSELQAIYKSYTDNPEQPDIKEKLKTLYKIRKFRSAGTHLHFKDRRHTTSNRKRLEDY